MKSIKNKLAVNFQPMYLTVKKNQMKGYNYMMFILHKQLTKPRGPILGARDEVAPTSPPTHLRYTEIHVTYY